MAEEHREVSAPAACAAGLFAWLLLTQAQSLDNSPRVTPGLLSTSRLFHVLPLQVGLLISTLLARSGLHRTREEPAAISWATLTRLTTSLTQGGSKLSLRGFIGGFKQSYFSDTKGLIVQCTYNMCITLNIMAHLLTQKGAPLF